MITNSNYVYFKSILFKELNCIMRVQNKYNTYYSTIIQFHRYSSVYLNLTSK